MPDIFLSYSRDDQACARRFAAGLEREGFSVWWDQALQPGEAFDQVTEKALEEAGAVIVLWSKTSVTSRWVRAEATQAQANNRLVPVMIEPCKRPIMFELTHTVDLAGWKGDAADPAWQSFIAGVRRVTGTAGHLSAAPQPVARRPAWTGLRVVLPALAALLVLGGVGYWLLMGRTGQVAADTLASTETGPLRILVLPFVNQSRDPDQDYFARGLTEELLNGLTQIKSLRPFGRGTTFSFEGQHVNPREISDRLGVTVDYLLEGAVLKGTSSVRVIPQLISTKDGTQLPMKSYEGDLRDWDALQHEIAADVARAVGIVLEVGDLPPRVGGTNNPEAFDLYLRAMDLWRTGVHQLPEAIPLLRKAFELDPGFGIAGQALFVALGIGASNLPASSAVEYMQLRDRVIRQLEAMPLEWQRNSGTLAGLALRRRQWAQAVDALEGVTQSAEFAGLDTVGVVMMSVGRMSDAAPQLRRGTDADPLATPGSFMLQSALYLLGRDAEANVERERISRLGGVLRRNQELEHHLILASSAQAEDVNRLKELLRGADGKLEFPLAGEPPAILDDPTAVLDILRREFHASSDLSQADLTRLTGVAQFYGDSDLALAALRRNLIDQESTYPLGPWQFPRLRGDARYKEIVRDMGLVDYWRQSGNWGDFCKPVGADDFECH